MIPMHAEATSDPQQLRWVMICDPMPANGRVQQAPGRLGALQDAGVIDEMTVAGTAIVITLAPRHRWHVWAEEIRAALDEALRNCPGWRVESPDCAGDLAHAVQELLGGPIGELARSHGGTITLIQVTGDHVTVQMSGACNGCPASGSTLHDTLQRELRRRFGHHVTVGIASSSVRATVTPRMLSLFTR